MRDLPRIDARQGHCDTGGRRLTQNPPQKPTEQPNPNPPVAKQGLEVISDPTNAEVWIDGTFRGLSPYIAVDISTGWHKVVIRKTGFYESSNWVDFESDYMLHQTTLVQMMGYLQLSLSPQEATVSVGGRPVTPGLTQLPVGTYTVIARLFGYTDFQQSVTIEDKTTTSLDVALTPAEFAVNSLSVPKPAVNPDNPGLLGLLEASFSVTGPGSGSVIIRDQASTEVFAQALPGVHHVGAVIRMEHAGRHRARPAGRLVHPHRRRAGQRFGSTGPKRSPHQDRQDAQDRTSERLERKRRAALCAGRRVAPRG